MYSAVTRNIEVQVRPFYLEDRSDPSENRYVWGYQVTIDNQSDEFVQLLSRYWHITDGTGRVEEVRGAGVVGDQPELNPGDSYQYTSGLPALDAVRHHGRPLHDAQCTGRDVQCSHPRVFARFAWDQPDGELTLPWVPRPRFAGERWPGEAGTERGTTFAKPEP